jgi:hypothetical protein
VPLKISMTTPRSRSVHRYATLAPANPSRSPGSQTRNDNESSTRAAQAALDTLADRRRGGHISFDPAAANLTFSLVSSRYERASLIVTSDKPFSASGEIFGDETVAAAMIDRLVHHAEILSLKATAAGCATRPRPPPTRPCSRNDPEQPVAPTARSRSERSQRVGPTAPTAGSRPTHQIRLTTALLQADVRCFYSSRALLNLSPSDGR